VVSLGGDSTNEPPDSSVSGDAIDAAVLRPGVSLRALLASNGNAAALSPFSPVCDVPAVVRVAAVVVVVVVVLLLVAVVLAFVVDEDGFVALVEELLLLLLFDDDVCCVFCCSSDTR